MSVFKHPEFQDHEQVVFVNDQSTGLRAIIAVHDTRLGPAVGGCRMFPYNSDDEALTDVLRLSRGMTFKSALAGLPFGGGKSVIMGDPRHEKTPAMMAAMGAAVDRLGGAYVIAEDSGTSPLDMRQASTRTPYVKGLEDNDHGGDPSPHTAQGVFLGIKAAIKTVYKTTDLEGIRVAIQGLGHVGYHLAGLLSKAGVSVMGCDIHAPNVRRAEQHFGLIPIACDEIMTADCDVLAPCALGATLNAQSIPNLRAKIVAGAANNQLASAEDGERLHAQGVVYCPDFAVNAGGVIEIHHQGLQSTKAVRDTAINGVGEVVLEILERSQQSGISTQRVAIELAEERLRIAHAPAHALQNSA